jgi:hypothetical protein
MAARVTVAATAKVISKPRRFTPRRAALTLVGSSLDHNDMFQMFFVCYETPQKGELPVL